MNRALLPVNFVAAPYRADHMVENTTAAADNSETTATNYDARISEIVGAEVPKTEEAPEVKSEKSADATEEAQTKTEGDGTNEGVSTEKDGTQTEAEKSEAAPITQDDANAPMKRIDRRIVTKALQNAALAGHEIDENQIMAILATKSGSEKKNILMELLSENATLRGKESAEASEEDIEAIVESRAEQKLEEKMAEREIAEMEKAEDDRKEAWHNSLASIIKDNPVLDEKSSDYDPKLAEALEIILSDDGETPRFKIDPKLAWEKVQVAAGIAIENAKLAVEQNRSKAMSGAMSGTGSKTPKGEIDWDEVARLAQEDPEEYKRRVKTGEIPAM
jgi:hypothetical protein